MIKICQWVQNHKECIQIQIIIIIYKLIKNKVLLPIEGKAIIDF